MARIESIREDLEEDMWEGCWEFIKEPKRGVLNLKGAKEIIPLFWIIGTEIRRNFWGPELN